MKDFLDIRMNAVDLTGAIEGLIHAILLRDDWAETNAKTNLTRTLEIALGGDPNL